MEAGGYGSGVRRERSAAGIRDWSVPSMTGRLYRGAMVAEVC
ncbi:hypothetical protein [Escherichia coli]|nr:hypothetical protein [Escherichia coli]